MPLSPMNQVAAGFSGVIASSSRACRSFSTWLRTDRSSTNHCSVTCRSGSKRSISTAPVARRGLAPVSAGEAAQGGDVDRRARLEDEEIAGRRDLETAAPEAVEQESFEEHGIDVVDRRLVASAQDHRRLADQDKNVVRAPHERIVGPDLFEAAFRIALRAGDQAAFIEGAEDGGADPEIDASERDHESDGVPNARDEHRPFPAIDRRQDEQIDRERKQKYEQQRDEQDDFLARSECHSMRTLECGGLTPLSFFVCQACYATGR